MTTDSRGGTEPLLEFRVSPRDSMPAPPKEEDVGALLDIMDELKVSNTAVNFDEDGRPLGTYESAPSLPRPVTQLEESLRRELYAAHIAFLNWKRMPNGHYTQAVNAFRTQLRTLEAQQAEGNLKTPGNDAPVVAGGTGVERTLVNRSDPGYKFLPAEYPLTTLSKEEIKLAINTGRLQWKPWEQNVQWNTLNRGVKTARAKLRAARFRYPSELEVMHGVQVFRLETEVKALQQAELDRLTLERAQQTARQTPADSMATKATRVNYTWREWNADPSRYLYEPPNDGGVHFYYSPHRNFSTLFDLQQAQRSLGMSNKLWDMDTPEIKAVQEALGNALGMYDAAKKQDVSEFMARRMIATAQFALAKKQEDKEAQDRNLAVKKEMKSELGYGDKIEAWRQQVANYHQLVRKWQAQYDEWAFIGFLPQQSGLQPNGQPWPDPNPGPKPARPLKPPDFPSAPWMDEAWEAHEMAVGDAKDQHAVDYQAWKKKYGAEIQIGIQGKRDYDFEYNLAYHAAERAVPVGTQVERPLQDFEWVGDHTRVDAFRAAHPQVKKTAYNETNGGKFDYVYQVKDTGFPQQIVRRDKFEENDEWDEETDHPSNRFVKKTVLIRIGGKQQVLRRVPHADGSFHDEPIKNFYDPYDPGFTAEEVAQRKALLDAALEQRFLDRENALDAQARAQGIQFFNDQFISYVQQQQTAGVASAVEIYRAGRMRLQSIYKEEGFRFLQAARARLGKEWEKEDAATTAVYEPPPKSVNELDYLWRAWCKDPDRGSPGFNIPEPKPLSSYIPKRLVSSRNMPSPNFRWSIFPAPMAPTPKTYHYWEKDGVEWKLREETKRLNGPIGYFNPLTWTGAEALQVAVNPTQRWNPVAQNPVAQNPAAQFDPANPGPQYAHQLMGPDKVWVKLRMLLEPEQVAGMTDDQIRERYQGAEKMTVSWETRPVEPRSFRTGTRVKYQKAWEDGQAGGMQGKPGTNRKCVYAKDARGQRIVTEVVQAEATEFLTGERWVYYRWTIETAKANNEFWSAANRFLQTHYERLSARGTLRGIYSFRVYSWYDPSLANINKNVAILNAAMYEAGNNAFAAYQEDHEDEYLQENPPGLGDAEDDPVVGAEAAASAAADGPAAGQSPLWLKRLQRRKSRKFIEIDEDGYIVKTSDYNTVIRAPGSTVLNPVWMPRFTWHRAELYDKSDCPADASSPYYDMYEGMGVDEETREEEEAGGADREQQLRAEGGHYDYGNDEVDYDEENMDWN